MKNYCPFTKTVYQWGKLTDIPSTLDTDQLSDLLDGKPELNHKELQVTMTKLFMNLLASSLDLEFKHKEFDFTTIRQTIDQSWHHFTKLVLNHIANYLADRYKGFVNNNEDARIIHHAYIHSRTYGDRDFLRSKLHTIYDTLCKGFEPMVHMTMAYIKLYTDHQQTKSAEWKVLVKRSQIIPPKFMTQAALIGNQYSGAFARTIWEIWEASAFDPNNNFACTQRFLTRLINNLEGIELGYEFGLVDTHEREKPDSLIYGCPVIPNLKIFMLRTLDILQKYSTLK